MSADFWNLILRVCFGWGGGISTAVYAVMCMGMHFRLLLLLLKVKIFDS